MDDLQRVLEDVLPVARPVPESAEDLDELLVELAAVRLEHGLLARLSDVLLELRLRLVVHLLDARRMDPAVLDELVEREAGDLASQRVERRQDDRVRRVVDDEVDARQVLERADVAAFPADDAPLEVVGRELDDGHGRLCRVTRRDTLEGVRDERACPPSRVRPRLLLHLPHVAGELVAYEVLRPLEQLLFRLVGGQPGDTLERRELFLLALLQLLLQRLDVHLAVTEPLIPALELGELLVDLLFLLDDALLDLQRSAAGGPGPPPRSRPGASPTARARRPGPLGGSRRRPARSRRGSAVASPPPSGRASATGRSGAPRRRALRERFR